MKSTGENRQLGEKPVPVPLCPPQISHGLDLGSNPGLRGERPATNRLSHGTAYIFVLDFTFHPNIFDDCKGNVLRKVGKFICLSLN
jgi:hypothetical protein